MSTYQIESISGIILGEYQGETEEEAVDAMWDDADAAPEHRYPKNLIVTEID